VDDNRLRQLLIQTDAATPQPRTGDVVNGAIRRRALRRRDALTVAAAPILLFLAFYAGCFVTARNRPSAATPSPSAAIPANNPAGHLTPLSDETEFRLEQAVLSGGIDAMPPWHPPTLRAVEIPELEITRGGI
jgi:hypothetical protein